MDFLDRRAGVICNELRRLAVKQRKKIDGWEYKKGFFIHPEDVKDDLTEFESFDSDRMYWYGPDEHYWFRCELTVPEEFDNKPLWLHISTAIEGWAGGDPQFLLFVDKNPLQGVDSNHNDILLSRAAISGKTYLLELQAYSGRPYGELKMIAEAREIDPEITGLYYDMKVPMEAFPRLEKDGKPRRDLERVLNHAVNLLDLRTPYSEDFYDSVHKARKYLDQALYTDLAGSDEVIATCIGHTHIDVAWLWTVAQTQEKTVRSFATVLKLMDEYPGYQFMSSQPQLYQFLKERYPKTYEQVKQKIKDKRWEPEGGMWVEADCNLTSGESLARQFLYGKRFFKEEFGLDNEILWLPDVFGYSGALPQIMKKSGIKYFMTTKLAWNQFNQMPYDTFMWRGIDGTEILTHLVTTLGVGQSEDNFFTTYNGMLHPDAILGGWHRYQNKDINNDILISYGYGDGGGGPTRDMLETSIRMEKGVEGIPKVRQAFSHTYFEELEERVQNHPRLPRWEGELYFEYHRGTYTSMARNKRSNRKAELHMMDLELLSVLAKEMVDYPHEKLDDLWKVILRNQFHDILPGSAIHEVYEVSKHEYEQVEEKIGILTQERLQKLLKTEENNAITIFNTTGFERDDLVVLPDFEGNALQNSKGDVFDVQKTKEGAIAYIEHLPSKGYEIFTPAVREEKSNPIAFSEDGIETPYYIIKFDENGCMTRIWDKENKREVLREGEHANLLRMYEDKPMSFDDWDIDIYYTEKFWDVTDLAKMEWIEEGPIRAALYQERRVSNSTICQKIYFYADSRRIDFETKVDWREHQHLLKVHFPVNVHTDEATYEIQYGNLTRKTHSNTSWDKAQFESCGQKWADLSEGHYGVSILNDCKYGHSIKDGVIGLTLIKSGTDPNPTADQEVHHFAYSIYPHAGTWKEGETVKQAYFFNQPVLVHAGNAKNSRFSYVSVDARNVVLETIKEAEDKDGVIIRLYECENALTNARLTFDALISSACECSLIEEETAEVKTKGNTLKFAIKPYEIKSFRIRF